MGRTRLSLVTKTPFAAPDSPLTIRTRGAEAMSRHETQSAVLVSAAVLEDLLRRVARIENALHEVESGRADMPPTVRGTLDDVATRSRRYRELAGWLEGWEAEASAEDPEWDPADITPRSLRGQEK